MRVLENLPNLIEKNPQYIFFFQLFYYGKVLEKARTMDNWTDYFYAFVKVRKAATKVPPLLVKPPRGEG